MAFWRAILLLGLVVQQAAALPAIGATGLSSECEATSASACCAVAEPADAKSCCSGPMVCRCDHEPGDEPALPTRSSSADQMPVLRHLPAAILAEPTTELTCAGADVSSRPWLPTRDGYQPLHCVWLT